MMGSMIGMIAAARLSAAQALAAWPVLVGRHPARQGRCHPGAAESRLAAPACARASPMPGAISSLAWQCSRRWRDSMPREGLSLKIQQKYSGWPILLQNVWTMLRQDRSRFIEKNSKFDARNIYLSRELTGLPFQVRSEMFRQCSVDWGRSWNRNEFRTLLRSR